MILVTVKKVPKTEPGNIKLYELTTGPFWPFRSGTSEMENA